MGQWMTVASATDEDSNPRCGSSHDGQHGWDPMLYTHMPAGTRTRGKRVVSAQPLGRRTKSKFGRKHTISSRKASGNRQGTHPSLTRGTRSERPTATARTNVPVKTSMGPCGATGATPGGRPTERTPEFAIEAFGNAPE